MPIKGQYCEGGPISAKLSEATGQLRVNTVRVALLQLGILRGKKPNNSQYCEGGPVTSI